MKTRQKTKRERVFKKNGDDAAFKALSIVVGETKNGEILDKLKEYREACEAVDKQIRSMMGLYDTLVWTARSSLPNRLEIGSRNLPVDEVERYHDEVARLSGPAGDWHHGFNSGVLGTLRLVSDLQGAEDLAQRFNEDYDDDENLCTAESLREQAIEEFPRLDT